MENERGTIYFHGAQFRRQKRKYSEEISRENNCEPKQHMEAILPYTRSSGRQMRGDTTQESVCQKENISTLTMILKLC